MGKNRPLDVEVKGGELMIRIGINTLATATIALPALYNGADDYLPKIPDPEEWANSIVRQLLDEEEDGTTLVHRMLDQAFLHAMENGEAGISMPGDDDYNELSNAKGVQSRR